LRGYCSCGLLLEERKIKKITFITFFWILAFAGSIAVADEGFFYKYTDKDGRIHIVDSEMLVPYAYQEKMEKIPKGRITEIKGISKEKKKNNEKSLEDSYTTDLLRYKSKRNEMENLVKKKKNLRNKYNAIKKEHDTRALRHPDFYHQTFAAKRKTLKKLKTKMKEIEDQISDVDKEIKKFRENSRREGIPLQWMEVEEEEDQE